MVIVQAIVALISRSAGSVLNAVFGWAVVALFGRTAQRDRTVLSAVLGAAAAWPLLLLGIAFPKAAALAIAFVPLSKSIPGWILRVAWIALAVSVPFVVGFVFAARAPQHVPPESFLKRVARGIPLTLGLAGAFWMMGVITPVLQLISAIRKRHDEHIHLITEHQHYQLIAHAAAAALTAHGFEIAPKKAPWWMTVPVGLLRRLGGDILQAFVPLNLAYYRGPELEFALYPSDALIRSTPTRIARAHGALAEALGPLPALETTDVAAQALERKLKAVWSTYSENPMAHRDSALLIASLRALVRQIDRCEIEGEDWQILYRQANQVERAVHGFGGLLEEAERKGVAESQTGGGSASRA